MSCHGCADTFGFWKREIGCPSCGFSYCQKCLRFKINVIDEENGGANMEKVVCNKCYIAATEKKEPHDKQANAVAAAKAVQVLESMDTPIKHPITVYREERFSNLKRGLSIEDQKLVERLEGLRNFTNESAKRRSSEHSEDIETRLARLKDMDYKPSTGNSSLLLKQKPVTEEDLLNRLVEETNLDKNFEQDLVSDIESRLAKLRGVESSDKVESKSNVPGSNLSSIDVDKSHEDQVQDIINRYVKEVELDAKTKAEKGLEEMDSEDEEKLSVDDSLDEDIDVDQLCRICDEKRATMSCKECDGDIFCTKCFKEFHDEIGESHKPSPVKFQH